MEHELSVEVLARLGQFIDMRSPSECWEWTGPRSRYGVLNVGRVPHLAHRLAYRAFYGPVPPGLQVLHSCDNPPCCNPHHLRLGTQSENILESVRKGRHPIAARTHCPQGHPYDEKNTWVSSTGARQCRACHSARQVVLNRKKRAAVKGRP